MALLLSFLAAAGSAMGAGPHHKIGADRHPARIWPIICGDTAAGRKGTSIGLARSVVARADPSWAVRTASNVGSGEAVIWHVRDPQSKPGKDGTEVVTDPGVDDKRLFVIEEEFASVLKVARRDGSVLSPILRSAWGQDDLVHTVKHAPARATGAHIVVVGHITSDELRRELSAAEKANGFANRFLFAMSRRSKSLPRGGNLDDSALDRLADRLATLLDYARSRKAVRQSEGFWDVYEPRYAGLTNPRSGIAGAVLGRGAPYVHRLALLFALLDGEDCVTGEHAHAAFAVWDYCRDSVYHLFAEASGDLMRDVISTALTENPEGLTRTEVRDLFKRHQPTGIIGAALDALRDAGLAEMEMVRTNGRSIERWRATKATKATEGAYVASVAYVARELDDEWMRWAGSEAEIFMAEEEVG